MASTNVPVTVAATIYDYDTSTPTVASPRLGIGSKSVVPSPAPPPPNAGMGFWFVVINLTDLSVVANEFVLTHMAPSSTIPVSVQPYVGNGKYFLFFVTHLATVATLPQGALYDFLIDAGAGPVALPSVEQLFATLGSENVRSYSYILAASMDTGDNKGFEDVSFSRRAILSFQFMPVTVKGQTQYVPIALG
jgi:hypothetical protein